jgi:hypothetical protein
MLKADDLCSFRRSDGTYCNWIILKIKNDSATVKFNSRNDERKYGLKIIQTSRLMLENEEANDYSNNNQSIYGHIIQPVNEKFELNQLTNPDKSFKSDSVKQDSEKLFHKNSEFKSKISSFHINNLMCILLFLLMFGCISYLIFDHYEYLKAVSTENLMLQ